MSNLLQFEWRERQAVISKLKSSSMPMGVWLSLGLTATEVTEDIEHFMSIYIILDRAWRRPFSIKSTFARSGAFHVALAASEALITTNIGDDIWGNKWCISEIGKEIKGELNELFQDLFAKANGRNLPTH